MNNFLNLLVNLLLGLRATADDFQSDGGLPTQIPSEETEDAELFGRRSAGGKNIQDSALASLLLLVIAGNFFHTLVCLDFAQFMDLRTRYTALVTLITQYVKFASETLKRAEDEEVRDADLKASFYLYFFISTLRGAEAPAIYRVCIVSSCLLEMCAYAAVRKKPGEERTDLFLESALVKYLSWRAAATGSLYELIADMTLSKGSFGGLFDEASVFTPTL